MKKYSNILKKIDASKQPVTFHFGGATSIEGVEKTGDEIKKTYALEVGTRIGGMLTIMMIITGFMYFLHGFIHMFESSTDKVSLKTLNNHFKGED